MSLTNFRAAVRDRLQTVTGIPMIDGYLEGPIETRDLGCVWPVAKREDEDNAALERIELRARIFKRYVRSTNPETPIDPSELEALAETVQGGLDDIQGSAGPWYFRVTGIEFDVVTNGIEFTVEGVQLNVFAQV